MTSLPYIQGGPKSKTLPNYKKIVLKHASQIITSIRQIKVPVKRYNIIR